MVPSTPVDLNVKHIKGLAVFIIMNDPYKKEIMQLTHDLFVRVKGICIKLGPRFSCQDIIKELVVCSSWDVLNALDLLVEDGFIYPTYETGTPGQKRTYLLI